VGALLLAIGCLVVAAYVAFDYADYGIDSTCGNLFNRKGSTDPCADIMRNRLLAVIGLLVAAGVLGFVAWSKRERRDTLAGSS
jgi:hypothetical protein